MVALNILSLHIDSIRIITKLPKLTVYKLTRRRVVISKIHFLTTKTITTTTTTTICPIKITTAKMNNLLIRE